MRLRYVCNKKAWVSGRLEMRKGGHWDRPSSKSSLM